VTHGVEYTKTSILLYTVLLYLICLLPALVGMTGIFYLTASTALCSLFVWHAWKLKYTNDESRAIKTFVFSIYHLMLLFVALLIDHYIM
jgi:protoheme IX farnesyltransferase